MSNIDECSVASFTAASCKASLFGIEKEVLAATTVKDCKIAGTVIKENCQDSTFRFKRTISCIVQLMNRVPGKVLVAMCGAV